MMEKADSGQKLCTGMRLWEFPDQYIVQPTDGSSGSLLAISRSDGTLKLIDALPECSKLRVPKIRTIFGVIGMLKLLAGSYLIVITERECVGSYMGHPIFKISSLKILHCNHALQNSPVEQKKMETEFSEFLNVAENTPGLYFSYETNLTLSCQRLHELGDESKSLPLWRQADPRFLWNNYLLELLIDNKLDSYLLPVIQGSFQHFQAAIEKDIVDVTLIARRCSRRNGTRMWRRGADSDGYVANFVETEQIIQMHGNTASFVQVRGSMPFTWKQIVDLTYKPKFEIVKPEEAPRIAERHFLDLRKTYRSVLAIDLVNKHGGEGRLSEKFANAMQRVTSDDVRYVHFDFHHICGHVHFERLSILYEQIEDFLEKSGYLLLNEKVWANHGDDISIQYSGTPALKGDFVRYGQRTAQGILNDFKNALMRYYLNNFVDGTKQDAIDLLQGHYIISVSRDLRAPSHQGGFEAVASFPVALSVVLAGIFLSVVSLRQGPLTFQRALFSLLCAGMSIGIAAFVKANGRVFCNRPRLHKPH
ncbi:hypothetical protein SAY86_017946 [Trapa natans]|uniref:SAC domain-containing protein n=1 Tax=Trapa natans TaxID=22666 RepID=A0AAN7M2F7_TRANT|nr:hypothetical protein SAY86_017946 [Trapa natans]